MGKKGERERDLPRRSVILKMKIRALLSAIIYTVCVIASMGLLGSEGLAAVKDNRDLAKYDWSVNAIPNLASKPPYKERVWQLLAESWRCV
jgi:hypothetical protein